MDPSNDHRSSDSPAAANSTSCPAIHHPGASTSHTELLRDVERIFAAPGRFRHNRPRLVVSAGSQLYSATGNDDNDCDSLHDVVIDVAQRPAEPTSAMLNFCKRRFLLPFVHLLGLVGLRPISVEASDWSFWLGHVQSLCVMTVLLFGYALQYVASFRRDRGIWYGGHQHMQPQQQHTATTTTWSLLPSIEEQLQEPPAAQRLHLGETLFVYVVPAVLHACGFALALCALRLVDKEHLQNLVERVFIQCSGRPLAARMVAALWAYVAAGLVWLALMTGGIVWPELWHSSSSGVAAVSADGYVRPPLRLRWFAQPTPDAVETVRWLLLLVVFVHDLVQAVVITTYAIQCHLLRGQLENLREKLVMNTIDPMDWMRVRRRRAVSSLPKSVQVVVFLSIIPFRMHQEMSEFRKLLHHLNKRIATPVCWFTLMNLIYTLAALIYALARYGAWSSADAAAPLGALLTNIGNVTLWLVAALFPFFQAAALTLRCEAAQTSGHQVRVRPFGHHNTSAENLNAVLMYASSLRMSAKLFRMPIQGNYLFFVILCLVVAVLTLGMCLNVTVGGW